MSKNFLAPHLFSASLLLAASVAAPVAAETTTLVCKVSNTKEKGWITPEYHFRYTDGKIDALVLDPLTAYVNDGEPSQAKLVANNDRRAIFDWVVDTVSGSGQTVRMVYSATYKKTNDKFKVVARPRDYKNSFSRSGTCERR